MLPMKKDASCLSSETETGSSAPEAVIHSRTVPPTGTPVRRAVRAAVQARTETMHPAGVSAADPVSLLPAETQRLNSRMILTRTSATER